MKIGVQTYTIRKLQKEDLKSSLAILKSLGINYVEIARIKFTKENALIIKDSNLIVTSIQLKLKELINNYQKIIEFCKITNCNTVVVSVLSLSAIIGKQKALIKFCEKLNQMALQYNQENINFAYHHHDFEFKFINGESKMDIILKNTNDNVRIVSDTYWTKKCGIEPHDLINKLGNRLIGLHLRDCIKINHKYKDAEIGSGIIDFNKILNKPTKNVLFGMMEQSTKTPIESIKKSYEYLVKSNYQHYFQKGE